MYMVLKIRFHIHLSLLRITPASMPTTHMNTKWYTMA